MTAALVGSAGAAFLLRLHQALSVARLHDISNVALEDPIEELRASLAVVIGAQGSASIKPDPQAQVVFLNERAVRSKKQGAFEPLVKLLAQYDVGELRFERSVKADQIRAFLKAFKESAHSSPREACRGFAKRLEEADLQIGILATEEVNAIATIRSVQVDDAVAARLSYARSLALLRTFLEHKDSPELGRYFFRKLVRGVQSLAALAARARHDLLAVTALRDTSEPELHHAVNTCILSMLLGQHANIPRAQLGTLGLAAMLHGFGRTDHSSPRDPYRSVSALLALAHPDDALFAAALVAFQYEARRGYPDARTSITEVHPFAKIVAVCEAYDAFVGEGVRPDKAMARLLQGKPRELDMALLGTFAGMLGTFPPGTAVEIDTGAIGVVCEPNPEDPNHPVIAILRDEQGREVDGLLLDLATLTAGGRHRFNIKAAVDPVKLGLKIPQR